MQSTLKEPDWVGEDALAMKRAATEARKARFTRRVRVPSPDERIKTRRDAYAGHLRRRTAGGPSPVRQTLRFAAESAMRKDRGGAYPALRSTLEYKGLSDEQVMKRGTNIVPGADVDTWDFFARNETPPLRPVSPWPRPPPRASTARTCKRPKPEVWRPTTAYGTLDGTLSRRPGILDDDSTRRDFEIVRPWTPFPEPDATTVEEALYLWTQSDSPDLVEFLDRIKPPSPKMRRLRTAPEKLAPAPAEAPAPAPAWELPGFDADKAFRQMLSDNQKRRVLTAIEDDPDAFDEAVVAELRAQHAPKIIEAAAPGARGRSAPSKFRDRPRAHLNTRWNPHYTPEFARTLQEDWRARDEARGVEARRRKRELIEASDWGRRLAAVELEKNLAAREERRRRRLERRQKPFLVFAAGVLYAAALRRKFWLLKATDDASKRRHEAALKIARKWRNHFVWDRGPWLRRCLAHGWRLRYVVRKQRVRNAARRLKTHLREVRAQRVTPGFAVKRFLWATNRVQTAVRAFVACWAARRQVCRLRWPALEASARRRLADRALERQKRECRRQIDVAIRKSVARKRASHKPPAHRKKPAATFATKRQLRAHAKQMRGSAQCFARMDALWAVQEVNRRAPKKKLPVIESVVREECACNNVDASLLYVLSKKEINSAIDTALKKKRRCHVRNVRTLKAERRMPKGPDPKALLNDPGAVEAPVEDDGAEFVWPTMRLYTGDDLGDSWDLVVEGLVEKDLRARRRQLARRLSSLPDEHHIDRVATALLDDDSFLGDEVTLDDDWSGNDEDSSWTGLTHSSLNTAEAEANPDLVANTDS